MLNELPNFILIFPKQQWCNSVNYEPIDAMLSLKNKRILKFSRTEINIQIETN